MPAVGDVRRRSFIVPFELMSDDRRLLAQPTLGTPVAFGKPPAELVNRGFGIDAERKRVLTHVRTRHQSLRPVGQIVALEAGQKVMRDLRAFSDRLQRNLTLHTDPA